MSEAIKPVEPTETTKLDDILHEYWESWTGRVGPPVPVIIERNIWNTLLDAVVATIDPVNYPRVFRLIMKRRVAHHIVEVSEIEKVWRTERGGIRWKEGGYPALSEPFRKGDNAFIRGDVKLQLRDAWWMGREQTDLRILLLKEGETILVSAWWSRGGVGGLDGTNETDGDLWPVKLLLTK